MSVPVIPRSDVTVDGFHRPPWSRIPVGEVMRARVLTCDADMPLRALARMLVTHSVRAIVVVDRSERVTGVVTDVDVAGAGLAGTELTAGELAGRHAQAPAIPLGCTLEQAGHEMMRLRSTHAVVVDGRGAPIGMLSTLDLARVIAWGHL